MPRLRKSLGVMPNSRLPRRQKCALLLNPSDGPAQRWRSPRHRHLPQPIGRIVRRIVPCHLGIPGLHYGVASHWESSDLGASIDAGSPGLIANLAHLVLCAHRHHAEFGETALKCRRGLEGKPCAGSRQPDGHECLLMAVRRPRTDDAEWRPPLTLHELSLASRRPKTARRSLLATPSSLFQRFRRAHPCKQRTPRQPR